MKSLQSGEKLHRDDLPLSPPITVSEALGREKEAHTSHYRNRATVTLGISMDCCEGGS
jgi:hypothetical protein